MSVCLSVCLFLSLSLNICLSICMSAFFSFFPSPPPLSLSSSPHLSPPLPFLLSLPPCVCRLNLFPLLPSPFFNHCRTVPPTQGNEPIYFQRCSPSYSTWLECHYVPLAMLWTHLPRQIFHFFAVQFFSQPQGYCKFRIPLPAFLP